LWGVWDTVSSVGWIYDAVEFPYTARNPDIGIVRHAVSIDERRAFFRQNLSIYQQHRDLISIGAYQRGSDPRIDAAIDLWPAMQKFLVQPIEERVGQRDAVQALAQLFATAPQPARKAGA